MIQISKNDSSVPSLDASYEITITQQATLHTEYEPALVYVRSLQSYGFRKIEAGSALCLMSSSTITHTDFSEENDAREFNFDYTFDYLTDVDEIFNITCKNPILSAFNSCAQNTLCFYESRKLDKMFQLTGLTPNESFQFRSGDLIQLATKYIFELMQSIDTLKAHLKLTTYFFSEEKLLNIDPEKERSEAMKKLGGTKGVNLNSIEDLFVIKHIMGEFVKQFKETRHVIFSFHYVNLQLNADQSEITTRDCFMNLVFLSGDERIDLGGFLNSEKTEVDTRSLYNKIEKLLLHYLSSSADPKVTPYPECELSLFLSKILRNSLKRDVFINLELNEKAIEDSVNDLLYAELCKEVSLPNGEDDMQDYDDQSQAMQIIEAQQDNILGQIGSLNDRRKALEEELLEVSNQAPNQIPVMQNPLERIRKYSLSSQYERFLHGMNKKLHELVKSSNEIIHQTTARLQPTNERKASHDETLIQQKGLGANSITDVKHLSIISTDHKEQTFLVKNNEYPSLLLTGPQDQNFFGVKDTATETNPILIENIENLQNKLQENMKQFSNIVSNLNTIVAKQTHSRKASKGSQQWHSIIKGVAENHKRMKKSSDISSIPALSNQSSFINPGSATYKSPFAEREVFSEYIKSSFTPRHQTPKKLNIKLPEPENINLITGRYDTINRTLTSRDSQLSSIGRSLVRHSAEQVQSSFRNIINEFSKDGIKLEFCRKEKIVPKEPSELEWENRKLRILTLVSLPRFANQPTIQSKRTNAADNIVTHRDSPSDRLASNYTERNNIVQFRTEYTDTKKYVRKIPFDST